jgi:hypothetical protein
MKNLMVGTCKSCGKRHIRPAPANVAVCKANGVHGEAVIVTLKPSHPNVRFEMKEKIPAIEIVGETCAKPQPKKKKVFSSDGKSMWYEDAKK